MNTSRKNFLQEITHLIHVGLLHFQGSEFIQYSNEWCYEQLSS